MWSTVTVDHAVTNILTN